MTTLTIPRQHYEEVAALLKSKFTVITDGRGTLCTDVIEVRGEPVILVRSDPDAPITLIS